MFHQLVSEILWGRIMGPKIINNNNNNNKAVLVKRINTEVPKRMEHKTKTNKQTTNKQANKQTH